jgi:rhodanese-related sulfurtransferase
MNSRYALSIILLSLGAILAFLPPSARYSLHGSPEKLLNELSDESNYLTADQVARIVVTEDSTAQLIDLRSPEEFNSFSLPGAINIPYNLFLEQDLESYLNRQGVRTIFYANGDCYANYALTLARGMGFKNCFTMQGGINAWYRVVMNGKFEGRRLTARENALYETRTKAEKLFTAMNSLPDSLKIKYRALKEIERKKLDGGCE